jgi:hypothetical protein
MKHEVVLTILLIPAAPLFAAPGVETVFQPIALSGQPAPGLTNTIRFSDFRYVSLADDGRIAFTAQFSGPGVTATNRLGLWAGLPGALNLAVRTGELVPGDANRTRLAHLAKPLPDNSRAVAFLFIPLRPDQSDPTGLKPDSAGFYPENGPVLVLFLVFADQIQARLRNDLQGHVVNFVAGSAELSGPDIGPTNAVAIVAGPPTNVAIVAQQGSPAPGTSGTFTSFPLSSRTLALAPDGNVAFMADTTAGTGIWFGKAGTLQAVMFRNRPAPASLLGPGYTFGARPTSENVEVNSRGELACATLLAGPGLSSTNSEFVVAGPPNGLRIIARSGQPAPGIPGAFFRPFFSGGATFSHVLLGADGTAAFIGCYSETGYDFGLWLAPTNGATPILLMRTGQQAPGAPAGVVFTNSIYAPPIEAVFMNSRNQLTFRAQLGGPGTGSFPYGVWLADPDGTVNLIARTGDMLDVGGGVMKQISNVTFGVDPEFIAGPEDGRRTPFNDRGEVALVVNFADFSHGLFIARTGIVLSGERVGNDIRVRFPTLSNKTYRVEFATNAPAASWDTLRSPVNGIGTEVTVTDTNATALPRRFYRAVRLD